MADSSSKQRARKEPAPTDFAARIVQYQRKNAADTRPRPKGERPPIPSSSSKPPDSPRDKAAVKDEFTRERQPPRDEFARNMIATSSATMPRLFNPNVDPIPLRRTHEPEQMHDSGFRSSPPKGIISRPVRPEASSSRRLFDPKRDAPIAFAIANKSASSGETTRPPPVHRSSGDYLSASSTSMSSYPPSIGSSLFTLSQTSSSSSAPFRDKEDPNSPVVEQLKRLYRQISHAEKKLQEHRPDGTDESPRVVVQTRDQHNIESVDPLARLVHDHKELAELMHNFLTLTLSPQVPVSFHNYPSSCNIPSRLWNSFHRILENLRRISLTSEVALEYLSEFIYYCYNFYAGLLENPILDSFRIQWLEALGDLSRYRMLTVRMASSPVDGRGSSGDMFAERNPSEARIDDSPSPSVGPAAAQALDTEPESETWRKTAREWYAQAIKEMPGQGRLHHHLGLVSRDAEDEEMRAVYHFVKSTMTSTIFPTSRETILSLFTPELQAKRMQPDARTADLFLLLHGMLITHVQLDDFAPSHARFVERLALEGAEEREWIMMALINIGALFEYGRHDGALRYATANAALGGNNSSSIETRITAVVNRTDGLRINDGPSDDKSMEVDEDTPRTQQPHSPELSHSFNLALNLTFGTLSYVLRNPWRKANEYTHSSLNPYTTIILTFLGTLMKHPAEMALLERAIPWDDLANFFNTIPRSIIQFEMEHVPKTLTQGCSAMAEDWCMRGTDWMRRAYDRGFWKAGDGGEVEVLDTSEETAEALSDGIIEDDEVESNRPNTVKLRWVRCFRTAQQLVRAVEGLQFDRVEKRWSVEGRLREKVEMWKDIERREREEGEARRMRVRKWDDDMEVDEEEETEDYEEEEDSYDEDDSEQVRELKARRRHYRALLQAQNNGSVRRRAPASRSTAYSRIPLHVVAGYSVLVIDTNILLSSLSMFSTLIESLRWTIVVPLAVVTELDGLSSNNSQLGIAASAALTYLTSHLRSHALSLKVQTSRGNYLSSLSVRREQVDLRNELSWERNMDDLILRAAIWHDEHWVDRSGLLKAESHHQTKTENASARVAKVVLLTFDRNLRVKARSRQLDAADEKDMASILAIGT